MKTFSENAELLSRNYDKGSSKTMNTRNNMQLTGGFRPMTIVG